MQQYNCIIIEDEPLAAEILQDYIADVPFLTFIKHYDNALDALGEINKYPVDLIFLDINLPKLNGTDFVITLKNPPHIIIISAYAEYALQGYDLNVVDYLLKPIRFSRFLQAVNKLKFISTRPVNQGSPLTTEAKDYLLVYVQKRRVKVFFKDILYIESQKEYIKIVIKDGTITTKSQLGQIEANLDKKDFLRIHRSFIVAKDKITSYTSTEIGIQNKILPIGRSYKELVIGILDES